MCMVFGHVAGKIILLNELLVRIVRDVQMWMFASFSQRIAGSFHWLMVLLCNNFLYHDYILVVDP
jgi:hypothetical protein